MIFLSPGVFGGASGTICSTAGSNFTLRCTASPKLGFFSETPPPSPALLLSARLLFCRLLKLSVSVFVTLGEILHRI